MDAHPPIHSSIFVRIALGITNQRETTVIWDAVTGEPLAPAMIWFDTRTQDLVDEYTKRAPNADPNAFRDHSGLPISTYFSALKLCWFLKHHPEAKKAYLEKRLRFGTVDSWLLYNLLDDKKRHVTDVTNASRTMLLNLKTLKYDPELLAFFDLEESCLPKIKSSSELYGVIAQGPFKGIPITGVSR